MTNQEPEIKVYSPLEAARKLGISVQMLKYHRLKGHIEGTDLGNTTVFTEKQIAAADLSPKKRGPKVEEKKIEGTSEESGDAAHQWHSYEPALLAVS